MCTLILLDRVVPEFPVVVAANRDEFYARPAAPPARFVPGDGKLAFVAPQDLEAGGTWMGLNSNSVFVGLTNRPVATRDRSSRSRGLLVVDALGQPSAASAVAELERACRQPGSPFNLLAADGRETWLARRDGDRLETRPLRPGIHVVCNRDADDPSSRKVRRIEQPAACIQRCIDDRHERDIQRRMLPGVGGARSPGGCQGGGEFRFLPGQIPEAIGGS